MKKLFILIFTCFIYIFNLAQSLPSNENYRYSRTYLEPVINENSSAKQIQNIEYFNGLGKVKQKISIKSTPLENDLVELFGYDGLGRIIKNYLPVPKNTLNGNIQPIDENEINSFYNSSNPYYEKELESYSSNKLLQRSFPGQDWIKNGGHTIRNNSDLNKLIDAVKKFVVVTNYDSVNKIYISTVAEDGNYLDGELYKNSKINEDSSIEYIFRNDLQQNLLVRKNSGLNLIDTYYIYNEHGLLSFVIPALALKESSINSVTLDNLCYQYRYDEKNRLVEKKIPGKGWEYFVYDQQNRVVLTQDANLISTTNNFGKRGWLFSKYDKFGRVVYSGFFANSASRVSMQNALNSMSANYLNNEKRSDTSFSLNGIDVYYTKEAFPTGSMTLLGVNYYDTYPPLPSGVTLPNSIITADQVVLPQNGSQSTKSLQTASYSKNIEDDNWTKSFVWYNMKGKVLGGLTLNHIGGYSKVENKLNFLGAVVESYKYHKRLANDPEIVIKKTFEYDAQQRLIKGTHKINNETEEILFQNNYSELSQLKTKKVGGTNPLLPLQTIDYKYNIRGWLTDINNPKELGDDLFGYTINYNKVEGLEVPHSDYLNHKVKPKYNGNIAEVLWKTLTQENEPLKKYGYVYDGVDKLLAGFFQKAGAETLQEYYEKIDYDVNGNITNLKRSSNSISPNTTGLVIDNLEYDYVGNRLIKISDNSTSINEGYPALASPNIITYDSNGNMLSQLDKGISAIKYNFLDLPYKVTQNSKVADYLYRADGTKLSKKIGDIETSYLDEFQYKSTRPSEAGIGGGDIVTIDPNETPEIKLRIIPTSEGYYDYLSKMYVYHYKDQIGNIRLSYTDSNKDGIIQPRQYRQVQCYGSGVDQMCIDYFKPGEIVEVNDYYPFGLLHNYNFTSQNAYQYKFQEQELQENGWYSFKWRNYMPDTGRFFNIDPLSEKYAYQSHYNFSENRVVNARELEGLESIDIQWSDRDPYHGDFWNAIHFNWSISFRGGGDSNDNREDSQGPRNKNLEVGMLEHVDMDYGAHFENAWNSELNNAFGTMAEYLKPMAQILQNIGEFTGTSVMQRLDGYMNEGDNYYNSYNKVFDSDASLTSDLISAPFILMGGGEGSAGVKYVKAESAALKTLISTEIGAQAPTKVSAFRELLKSDGLMYISESIDVLIHNGKRYIMDGHHRIEAAILENAPLEIRELNRAKAMEKYPDKVKQVEQGLFD
ncbi:DUF6443 domain-containing protein [Chryseobacterium scophthalmum]|uniref:DUF6443 domain-containing protein n=1 Tax=Chryseobacterium scophthalmum TaxID=59733 RepID=UPI00398AC9BE